jgi:pilus assembly protein CpaF
MSESDHNNGHGDRPPPDSLSPIVPGRSGRPSYSLDALRERVERQFHEETAHRSDILIDLDTGDKRRAHLLDSAYCRLFTFGPLDACLDDETITEITINGPADVHARRGMGTLEPTGTIFDDRFHLEGVLERVLATAGIDLLHSEPFLEAGVTLAGRAARISLISPPVSPEYSLEIRLHPRQPLSLDDLHTRFRAVPPQAAALLRAILAAGHGLLIVGDVGLGKTTLAGALAHSLPADAAITAVERAAEMHLPPHIRRRSPTPATPDNPGTDFIAEIQAALDGTPDWLIVDEIRGDESAVVWDALSRDNAPRYLWVFRGDSQPDRLRNALSMTIRQGQPAIAQAEIHRLLARHLPFVAAVKRIDGTPRLHLIAEWALGKPAGDDVPLVLRPLLTEQDDGWLVADNRPTRPLDLPDDFWE